MNAPDTPLPEVVPSVDLETELEHLTANCVAFQKNGECRRCELAADRIREHLAALRPSSPPDRHTPLERHEVQSLLRIIGAADAEDTPVGQHLMKRLRDMVGLTGEEVYCAQCYLNGSGWFELAKGACPNPKCVLTAYQKTRTGLRP